MSFYCSASDLFDHGVPRGATPNPGRSLYTLLSSVATLDGHGFVDNDPVSFVAVGDGALPSPLVVGTQYYVQRETESTFKIRATSGGSALSVADADEPVLVIAALPIDAAIEWASEVIDDLLTGHVVPLSPVPAIVRMTCAELAAGHLLARSGGQSASLAQIVDGATKRLERWAKGVPVQGVADTQHGNLGAVAAPPLPDARGWRRFGGL